LSDSIRLLIRQVIIAASLPETLSESLSIEIEKQLRLTHAGERIYLSKTGSRSDKEVRNELIRAQFNGRNHDELARRHTLSVRQVRNIVRGLRVSG